MLLLHNVASGSVLSMCCDHAIVCCNFLCFGKSKTLGEVEFGFGIGFTLCSIVFVVEINIFMGKTEHLRSKKKLVRRVIKKTLAASRNNEQP